MKKYLMTAMAAVAMGATFTSCSHNTDLYGGGENGETNGRTAEEQAELVKAVYKAAFEQSFGKVAPTVDWGFGPSTRALTRTITVNGDAYDKFPSAADVAANFPTAIPEDAKTDAELEAEWKGKNAVDENGEEIIAWGNKVTMWDMYAIYSNMVGKVINNIKVTTPGEYSVGHTWANPADRVYNVYINVGNGNDLTLKRNGAEHVNFYIMSGNVTIDSNFGECGGIISVAEGATVNDQRSHIAHNDGVKIYNKGTYNAQGSATIYNQELGKSVTSFDIGNHCTFYNEGKFTSVSELSYSPGDANTSYFMNLGDDAELTAPAMTLNSAGNFYNDGKVVITSETNVTQKGIYWVNAGYYKTGSIVFSAKNATFYNYCQLIVTGNAHMYDGEFNLMPNSYTEVATAEMDNFIVNMGGNTGINIKGNVDVKAQGDGTFQGFKNFGTNNYVLIGGKVTVASHKKTFSVESGITYSIKEIEIIKNGNVVTEDYLQSIGDGDYPVLDLQGTEAPFGKLTVTPKEFGQGCGATWKKDGDEPEATVYRVICEDLNAEDDSDFDFNDVVFDIIPNKDAEGKVLTSGATIKLICAGGIYHLTVDGVEVHEKFNKLLEGTENGKYPMINTGYDSYPEVEFTTDKDCSTPAKINENIKIYVTKPGIAPIELTAKLGEAAAKVLVDNTFIPLRERVSIKTNKPQFKAYVNGKLTERKWW